MGYLVKSILGAGLFLGGNRTRERYWQARAAPEAHESGALTDAEFVREKAKILAE